MTKERIEEQKFLEVIKNHDEFVICGHVRPDADALGSTLALGTALRQLGKKVWMINEDGYPESLAFLEGIQDIMLTKDLDVSALCDRCVLVVVDTGSFMRIGPAAEGIHSHCDVFVNIDHHVSNDYFATINIVRPDLPATGAVLYHLFREYGWEITPVMRDALYAAISTDTGSFQYQGTTAETFEMAADLVRLGVDVPDINTKLYNEFPWRKTLLMKEILNGLVLDCAGKLAYVCLTNQVKEAIGVLPEDTEGLINILRNIQGVKVAVIFEEIEDDRIRISLRSKDKRFNVSELAQRFGGGGHPMASGVRMRKPIQEACQIIVDAITQEFQSLGI